MTTNKNIPEQGPSEKNEPLILVNEKKLNISGKYTET